MSRAPAAAVVSLGHVKEDSLAAKLGVEPWEVERSARAGAPAAEGTVDGEGRYIPPVPKRVMAHPGGKITSNKAEALYKFL